MSPTNSRLFGESTPLASRPWASDNGTVNHTSRCSRFQLAPKTGFARSEDLASVATNTSVVRRSRTKVILVNCGSNGSDRSKNYRTLTTG